MAEFRPMVITNKGHALIAKMLSGQANIEFTKISLSENEYSDEQILELNELEGVKQTTNVSSITKTSVAAVQIQGAVTNASLSMGYYIKTIALYASDPDEGEFVYAACGAVVPGWMPPFNGVSTSGAFLKLITTVQNASNVSITVDPTGVATIGDIQELQKQITELRAYVGYTDDDIYGVEVDLRNNRFTRLAAAKLMNSGNDFDRVKAYGGRKRCILADDGVVLAYHSEEGYIENGLLDREIVKNGKSYPIGTQVQVMVEQPKFYYKVVPLELEKMDKEGAKGFHLRKARYYISDTVKDGFKLHPAFIREGIEKDYIYLSAYEGSSYDMSESVYDPEGSSVIDWSEAGDKLSSIANAKPILNSPSGAYLLRKGFRNMANRRNEKYNTMWSMQTIQSLSATQLLFLIEYASFNAQAKLGKGVALIDRVVGEVKVKTGATASLGNKSGAVGEQGHVSYRGEENPYGHTWKFVDGINLDGGRTEEDDKKGLIRIYVVDPKKQGFSYRFLDDVDNTTTGYRELGFTGTYLFNAYISAFGYDEEDDWLFVPCEGNGNSEFPVGDVATTYKWSWKQLAVGGGFEKDNSGLFSFNANNSQTHIIGNARLLCMP